MSQAVAAIMGILHEIRPFEQRSENVEATESYTVPGCVLVQLRGDVTPEEAEESRVRAIKWTPTWMRVEVEIIPPPAGS